MHEVIPFPTSYDCSHRYSSVLLPLVQVFFVFYKRGWVVPICQLDRHAVVRHVLYMSVVAVAIKASSRRCKPARHSRSQARFSRSSAQSSRSPTQRWRSRRDASASGSSSTCKQPAKKAPASLCRRLPARCGGGAAGSSPPAGTGPNPGGRTSSSGHGGRDAGSRSVPVFPSLSSSNGDELP